MIKVDNPRNPQLPTPTREEAQQFMELLPFRAQWEQHPEDKALVQARCQCYHLLQNHDWQSLVIADQGKQGLRNCLGDQELPPRYDAVQHDWYLYHNRETLPAVVLKDGVYYKVKRDGQGTILYCSDFGYLAHIPLSDIDIVKKSPYDRHFALARENELICPFELTGEGRVFGEFTVFYIGDKMGLYDFRHHLFVRPEYDYISFRAERPVCFVKEGVTGSVTLDGQFIRHTHEPSKDEYPHLLVHQRGTVIPQALIQSRAL
jgi:hypothetical protein